MTKVLHVTLLVLATGILCAGTWGVWGLNHHLIVAIDKWGASGDSTSRVLADLNAPCVGFHGSVTCGALAQLSQTTKDIGILAAQSALQVRQTGALITATAQNLNTVGESVKIAASHLSGTADALTGTANAATGTAQAATKALGTLNTTIGGFSPILTDSDTLLKTFNARISDPNIDKIIGNTEGITGHVDAVAGDLQKVADKTTGDILAPKPWWQKIGPYANDVVRAGCLITGRCP